MQTNFANENHDERAQIGTSNESIPEELPHTPRKLQMNKRLLNSDPILRIVDRIRKYQEITLMPSQNPLVENKGKITQDWKLSLKNT